MHVVIINGSPRTKKYSNTDKIIQTFGKGMIQSGATYELYSLSDRKEWEAAREAFYTHTRILIALPLYVECIPGLLLEFLETLHKKEENGTEISFILQSGFAEGCQLRCGEEFLKMLPGQLNCSYGGCLVKGDNFGIRIADDNQLEQILTPYEKMGELYGACGTFEFAEAKKFTGPEKFALPIRILLALAFKTVAKKKFIEAAKAWGCTQPLDDRPYAE